MAIPLYIASLLGAAGLILLMPRKGRASGLSGLPLTLLGTLFVAALPGMAWIAAAVYAAPAAETNSTFFERLSSGIGIPGMVSYYVFSTISILSAVRVITHRRPVYAALWFVMVVLSSAGLFLTLSAEFLTFAVILIYAGAILVTYMFVIMLATQAKSASLTDTDLPDYERHAREPIAAVAAGFLLLAVILTVVYNPNHQPNPLAKSLDNENMVAGILADRTATEIEIGRIVESDTDTATNTGTEGEAPPEDPPVALSNAERLGIDLFRSNPLGLELAGVILLVALVGAVVIAKTKVDTEDDAIATEREDEKALLAS